MVEITFTAKVFCELRFCFQGYNFDSIIRCKCNFIVYFPTLVGAIWACLNKTNSKQMYLD